MPCLAASLFLSAIPPVRANPSLEALRSEVIERVEAQSALSQQIVDSLFSFAELGYHEFETQRYLTGILEEHGFTVERDVAGIPSGWVATWGSGKPVISLGTDVDALPQLSQKPGVVYRSPIVDGAPGHGEGHNTGMGVILPAAIAVKEVMEREGLPGTLQVWPGIAEEILGGKAYFVREGIFADVDAVLYCHVHSSLSTWWGDHRGKALVSVEYTFEGEEAHAGVAPWEGRSALDAVELMNVGWNFRREHLRPQQRSHYVITQGGDQPNVVPRIASVWYYFRETDYEQVMNMWNIGNSIAEGAALMTGTSVSWRVLGTAWPRYMNRPLAEVIQANIQEVGMPEWSEADQTLAKAVQEDHGVTPRGLLTSVNETLSGVERYPDSKKHGGGSDDVGDISWNIPTGHLNIPSNIPSIPLHHWRSGIAVATPIAHKGALAGAKVYALTLLDLLHDPQIIENAWDFFENVQTRDQEYVSFLRPEDEPPVEMNTEIMERFRPALREFYYDPEKYGTYLEQLGIDYPVLTLPQD